MSPPEFAHQLNDNELRAIGLVAQEWAIFERLIHRIITRFLETDLAKGDMVGPAMGSKLALEFASGMGYMTFKTEQDAKAFQKLIERAGKLAGQRNDIVHLVWVRSDNYPDKLEPIGIKVRHTIQLAKGEISYRDFENFAREIGNLASEIVDFLNKRGLGVEFDE